MAAKEAAPQNRTDCETTVQTARLRQQPLTRGNTPRRSAESQPSQPPLPRSYARARKAARAKKIAPINSPHENRLSAHLTNSTPPNPRHTGQPRGNGHPTVLRPGAREQWPQPDTPRRQAQRPAPPEHRGRASSHNRRDTAPATSPAALYRAEYAMVPKTCHKRPHTQNSTSGEKRGVEPGDLPSINSANSR